VTILLSCAIGESFVVPEPQETGRRDCYVKTRSQLSMTALLTIEKQSM